ncbi:MAG: hypothetical protein WAW96_20480 [Alphaproteobacteria bacterium]
MSDLLPWVHAHIVELQASGLVAACIILLLAMVLLNRAANELNRSYLQRASSEPVFERIHGLLSVARERGEGDLSEALVLTRQAANETELPREAAN